MTDETIPLPASIGPAARVKRAFARLKRLLARPKRRARLSAADLSDRALADLSLSRHDVRSFDPRPPNHFGPHAF